MKNKKTISKILSLTLVFLLVTASGFFAFANEIAQQNTQDYTLSARIGENSDAEQVEVIVSLDNNAGLNGLEFDLNYDANVFTLTGVTDHALLDLPLTFSKNLTDVPYSCSWGTSAPIPCTTDGDVITFTFRAKDMEDMKEYHFDIENSDGGYYDISEGTAVQKDVTFNVKNTTYSIGEHSLTYYPAVDATGTTDGNIEYWYCSHCEKYFNSEEAAEEDEILPDEIVIPADPSIGGEMTGGSCKLTMAIDDAKPGMVDVFVNLEENGGVQALAFELNYNEALFKLVSVDAYGNWLGEPRTWSEDYTVIPYRMGWVTHDPAGSTQTGTLAKLTFEVLSEGDGSAASFTFAKAEATRTEFVEGSVYPVTIRLNVETKGEFVIPQLPKGVTVSGTVTSFHNDTDNVAVELWTEGAAEATYTLDEPIAGKSAVYQFENVEAGNYIMKVSKQYHGTREYEIAVGNADVVFDSKVYLIGDVTMDGVIDIGDHQRLFEHLQGIATIADEYQLKLADTTIDTLVDIGDHQRLFEHLQGIDSLTE